MMTALVTGALPAHALAAVSLVEIPCINRFPFCF